MMSILDRYIARAVWQAFALVLLVLLSLDAIFAMINQLQRGDLLRAVLIVLWELPLTAYEMAPVAVLLGAVGGLSGLAQQQELTAMRAAGASIWRVFFAVLHAGLPLALLVLLIGEWAVPHAAEEVRAIKSGTHARPLAARGKGFWVRDGDDYIHVGSTVGDSTLRDLRVIRTESSRIAAVFSARRAVRLEDGRWRLFQLQRLDRGEQGLDVTYQQTLEFDSLVAPDFLDQVASDPRWMSIADLGASIDYLRDNGGNVEREAHALWAKVANPISVVVMLLLAVPLVFGGPREGKASQRVFVACLVGLGYVLLNNVLVSAGQLLGTPAVFNTLLSVGVLGAVAVILLRRQDAMI